MIDTHAHIYDPKFDFDRDLMIEQALSVNINKILMPNCATETIERMLDCEKKYPGVCIPMMGLHPCYVTDEVEDELNFIKQWIDQRTFCAIGEIGLDYHWDITYINAQKHAYTTQMKWSLEKNLPICVHSRESTRDCIDLAKPFIQQGLKGVFHCFSGTLEEAKELTNLGFYLGIGGVLTYKKSGLDAIVKEIKIEHLILETDAPYLAPVPHRGKRNEVSMMKFVAQQLADIKQISIEEVETITNNNANLLFGLN